MNFATDDLREEILELFVHEHNKINDFSYVHADLTIIDLNKKKEDERKARLLDLAWIRRHDRERKNLERFITPETVKCLCCEKPMLSFVIAGHPRKYCSGKCNTKFNRRNRRNKCENQKQAQSVT